LKPLRIPNHQHRFSFDSFRGTSYFEVFHVGGFKLQQGDVRISRPGNTFLEYKNGAFVGASADMSRSLDDVEICQQVPVRAYEKAGPSPYRGPIGAEAITCTTAGLALATMSGIVVACPFKAKQTAKKDSNRIELRRPIEPPHARRTRPRGPAQNGKSPALGELASPNSILRNPFMSRFLMTKLSHSERACFRAPKRSELKGEPTRERALRGVL